VTEAPSSRPEGDRKKVPAGIEVVRAQHLAKSFGRREVLSDVSLTVDTGKTLVIMGGSGSGKTTCLRILMGQEVPNRGTVHLFGKNIYGLPPKELAGVRRRYGVVFQSGALLNSLSVGENVALPMRELTRLDDEVIGIMVKLRLDQVGLRDFENLRPSQLSGGMKKRVGIARALALDPEILFYDEPTSGLDPVMTAVITKLIRELSQNLGVASVVVTHDMKSAFEVADHIIMLYRGNVVAEGPPADLAESDDPIVRQFVNGEADGPIPLMRAATGLEEDLLED
jgi:phospholipid/cholesterol/gamma-HCH transport system ATP-binding protein